MMSIILQVMVISLISSTVSSTNLQPSQFFSPYLPNYSGHTINSGSFVPQLLHAAETIPRSEINFDYLYSKGLGLIDFIVLLTQLASRLSQLEESLSNLSTNCQQCQASASELASLKSNLSMLEANITANTNELSNIKLNLTTLEANVTANTNELSTVKSNLTILEANSTAMASPTSLGRMPRSCDDLQELGNIKSGFYNLMNFTKVSVVYCDFGKSSGDAGYEYYVGYADLKTNAVFFFFQRGMSDSTSFTKLPFEVERVNVGNAMDGTTGVFTAPAYGYYFFSFTGTVNFKLATTGNEKKSYLVTLLLDGDIQGFARVDESHTENDQWNTLHLEMTLNLRPNQQIWLETDSGQNTQLIGSTYTHFVGMLMEEDSFPF